MVKIHIFSKGTSKIFSGRNYGMQLRNENKLDELDKNNENVIIYIPKDTWTINSSFFCGLFEKSVIDLGKEKFLKKYTFKYDDETNVSFELYKIIYQEILDILTKV